MRKIIAVFKDQFTGNEVFNGESLEQVLDALVSESEDYKDYSFYDLTEVTPTKLKLALE